MTQGCSLHGIDRARTWSAVFFVCAISFFAGIAQGATNTWQGTTGAWASTTNWSLGHTPLSTEDVVFPTPVPSGGAAITVPAGALANSLTINGSYTLSGGDITRS